MQKRWLITKMLIYFQGYRWLCFAIKRLPGAFEIFSFNKFNSLLLSCSASGHSLVNYTAIIFKKIAFE